MKIEPALACCPVVTVSESALQVPRLGRRMARAGPDVWRLGRVWSSAELYSRGALVNGGRSLGHLFLVSRGDGEREREIRKKQGGCKFLAYKLVKWLPYSSSRTCTHTDLSPAHLFTNHFGIQTTSCRLGAPSAELHILQRLTFSI